MIAGAVHAYVHTHPSLLPTHIIGSSLLLELRAGDSLDSGDGSGSHETGGGGGGGGGGKGGERGRGRGEKGRVSSAHQQQHNDYFIAVPATTATQPAPPISVAETLRLAASAK